MSERTATPVAVSSQASKSSEASADRVFPQGEQRSSQAEVLQHMLELESSRHRLEKYARELGRLAELSAKEAREAQIVAQKKGDLVATLSHEIRTPLNGILGMASLLQGRSLGPVEQGYVDVIQQAGDGLLSLVDNVLDLAKIESDGLELASADVDIRRVAADALLIVGPSADHKGLTLASEIAPEVPSIVCGDALRLRQILLNLLSNAIKFTERGVVTLQIERIASASALQHLRFTVVDRGMGISPEGQARLFQPFSQADATISAKFGGTGLGLTICKRLAEMMGGSIGVTSTPGMGSSFWFTIAAAVPGEPANSKVAATPSGPAVSQCSPAASAPRILLVEDNAINQKVALLMLKKLGYTATVAENGVQAVRAAAEKQYDLILMDCLMPEMDGFHATAHIRQGPNNGSQIPIVAITANAFARDREACLAAGMSDYLAKPVREAELRSMIDKWLVCSPSTGRSPADRFTGAACA